VGRSHKRGFTIRAVQVEKHAHLFREIRRLDIQDPSYGHHAYSASAMRWYPPEYTRCPSSMEYEFSRPKTFLKAFQAGRPVEGMNENDISEAKAVKVV